VRRSRALLQPLDCAQAKTRFFRHLSLGQVARQAQRGQALPDQLQERIVRHFMINLHMRLK
jgi:hypothetical protein